MKKYTYIYSLLFTLCSFGLLQAQCIEESHSPFKNQGWKSCQKAISLVPERGERHWIMYDFGHEYLLNDLRIWNHNVWGEIEMGVKSIIIDCSSDLINWTTLGPYDVAQAPGSWKYVAEEAIDLGGVLAQFMLITVVETYEEDAPCAGIGEIKINVENMVSTDDPVMRAFNVYPNPATDMVNIEITEGDGIHACIVTNAVGQIIYQADIESERKIEIPLGNYVDGIYYVTVKNDQGTGTKSFVKIR